MKRLTVLLYGVLAYVLFLATFTYLIGFVGNLFVPTSLEGPLTVPLWQAIIINLGLILLFGLQHSIMARSWFKKWWSTYVPDAMERSTFVLFTCVVLIALYAFWQPMGGVVWQITNPYLVGIMYALFALGWVLVLASSFMINHFDLFGLRQSWLYFKGISYTNLSFRIPVLYQFVRHPLYTGILMAFWAAPTMSYSRLLFALVFTIYTLKAIQWEERDLIKIFGSKYLDYKSNVSMILPSLIRKRSKQSIYKTLIKKEINK